MNNDSNLTRVHDYIKATLPWAHGHQLNSLTTFVSAIFDKQSGCQAELARTQGNQEAACKRLSRLIHNERLSPKWLAESIAHLALGQAPPFGKVRLTIDRTTEDEQHLLTVSLVIGRRAAICASPATARALCDPRQRLCQSLLPPGMAQTQSLRVPRRLPSSDVGAITLLREITAPPVGPSKPRSQQAGAVGDLVFSQQLRPGCAPSHDRICSALQLRRGLQGREMVSRIQAGACQRHRSLVTIVRALCPGAADPDHAGDLLLATRRSKNERTLATRSFETTRPL